LIVGNPKDGLQYIWVAPGTFQMGCSPGDMECSSAEKPAHQVTITKGFWMGQTPVTQAAYQRVMGKNPSQFKGEKRPVEMVSWNEALGYCQALGMRLPTEAEWEYAARGGTTEPRYAPVDAVAWYKDNSGGTTHDVALKQPNGYGLYDMLGNVSQWVGDWITNYESVAATNPQGVASGQGKMLRGGNWSTTGPAARASYRGAVQPGERLNFLGFRCAGETLPN
jgi:formylglycine-generating enzyme required for sulfatase activity